MNNSAAFNEAMAKYVQELNYSMSMVYLALKGPEVVFTESVIEESVDREIVESPSTTSAVKKTNDVTTAETKSS